MNFYYIVTFETAAEAIKAEKWFLPYGGSIITAPIELSSGCGFAIRLASLDAILYIKEEFSFAGLYKITGRGKERSIEAV